VLRLKVESPLWTQTAGISMNSLRSFSDSNKRTKDWANEQDHCPVLCSVLFGMLCFSSQSGWLVPQYWSVNLHTFMASTEIILLLYPDSWNLSFCLNATAHTSQENKTVGKYRTLSVLLLFTAFVTKFKCYNFQPHNKHFLNSFSSLIILKTLIIILYLWYKLYFFFVILNGGGEE
jgi:hypothetical protein